MCNPNLLINTDFRNPVNQRGQSEYVKNGYCIDCWIKSNSNGTFTINDGYLTLTSSERVWLQQYFEYYDALDGKTITISVQKDNKILSATGKVPEGSVSSHKLVAGIDLGNDSAVEFYKRTDRLIMQIRCGVNDTVNIQAIKLELGTVSTLANEVVDYATELRKCQRYLQVYAGEVGSAIKSFGANDEWLSVIPLVAPMRVQPTVLVTTYFMLRNKGNYRVVSVYTYNVWRENSNTLSMWLEMNEALDADVADIFVDNNGMLILSAEL